MKKSIEVPLFPGFYESPLLSSDDSYYAIKEELEYYHDEQGRTDLTEDDLDIDYEAYEKDICEAYVEAFFNEAPDFIKKAEFDEMVSPKYYNYSTDRTFANCEFADDWKEQMKAFMEENQEWLKERIWKEWSSRDGFISFIDNRLDDWYEHLFEEEDERYLSIMIGYMMLKKDKDIAWYLTQDCLENIYLVCYVYIKEKEEAK